MNAPSRSPNASLRAKRPQRPLPALPAVQETKKEHPRLSHLVKDDIHEPFQLLESHPLSLICQYHNVKRVSLEEGVPPPFKLDVPVLHNAIEDLNALLPTHVLAVYDQESDQSEQSPTLLPHTASTSSGRPSLPATPLMIPVNAELWAHYFTSALSTDPVPVPSPSPSLPTIDVMRRHSRMDSMASVSSQTASRNSFSRSRPRSVLSLPVHVVRVPSAKALPLLLLTSLRILPQNRVMPALLPRSVLVELPAPPAILTQHLLLWLYPTLEDWERRSLSDTTGYSPFAESLPAAQISSSLRSPRLQPSPLLSPSLSPRTDTLKRLSSASASSLPSTSSSISSISPQMDHTPEPICALADPATIYDPDLRLLALTQQNFGLWADALALGVRESGVVRLAELAWTVASEARRARFGNPASPSDADAGGRSSIHSRQGRSRSRAPIPFLDAPPRPPSSPK